MKKEKKKEDKKLEIKDHRLAEKPEKLESIKKEQILIQVKEELDKENARNTSIKEGSYASVMHGAGYHYISPFAIALGASNAQVGMLASLPWILSPLSHLYGARLMEKQTRKKIVTKFVFIESLMWLLILALALVVYFGIMDSSVVMLILLYLIMVFLANLATSAWFSWMGDIIPEKIRGRYFAKRNKIVGTVTLVTMLLASFFLDFFKTKGLALIGFSLLFLIAAIARGISAFYFTRKYEPKLKLKKGYYFSLTSFLKNIYKDNFGRFTIFVSLLKLSVFIASPFFAVYLLRDLELSYFWFTAITITPIVFTLLFYPLWGRFSDKYGNKLTLKIGAILVPFVPIFWIFSSNRFYLLIVPAFVAGLGWAAFNLASNNYLYDISSPERRGLTFAYHSLLLGAGILIGGAIGSIITQYLPITFMNIILFAFLCSGILRLLVSIVMLPKINEIRKVRRPRRVTRAVLREIRPLHFHAYLHEPARILNSLIRKK